MNSRSAPNQKQMPLLSVLIPAYENVAGVLRIIKTVPVHLTSFLEVIVSDDSYSKKVERAIADLNAGGARSVKYFRHARTGNAVDNWNHLLDRASGEYVQLLHHDEWPLTPDYFFILLQRISGSCIDLFVLDCVLVKDGRSRRHSSSMLKRFIFNGGRFNLLLICNIVGSPSNIVHKRDEELRYDRDLKWGVDVEFYLRLGQSCESIFVINDLAIASDLNNQQTITSSIRENLPIIKKTEATHIYRELKHVKPGLILSSLFLAMHALERSYFKIFRKSDKK